MTSDEMTTGSLGATENERKWYAARSRWWNTTGGGSAANPVKGNNSTLKGIGAVKAGDGGVKFRAEWPEKDTENWEWIHRNNIDPGSGQVRQEGDNNACSPEVVALKRGPSGSGGLADAGRAARGIGESWLWKYKYFFGFGVVVTWVALQRMFLNPSD